MEIKRKIRRLLRCFLDRDYRFFVFNPPPFDTEFFCQQANLNINDLSDPLWHYIKTEREARAGLDFQKDEWRQLPNPHALFDVFFYLAKYFPHGMQGNAFAYYLKDGWKQEHWPGPYFDPRTYRDRSGWNEQEGDPLAHYTYVGASRVISPSLFFDISYYLDKTAFLNRYKKDIIRHHKLYGAKNGKSTTPIFDPVYYLNNQDENGFAKADPFSHFLTAALRDTPRPNEWFDPSYYAEQISTQSKVEKILSHYLTEGLRQQRYIDHKVGSLGQKPLISILVPVYNPAPNILNCCIRSVLYQTYPHWELCLADDCSTDEDIRKLLKQWSEKDSRIKVVFNRENQGISATTNAAARLASGDYIGFLDNDDEIAQDCLFHVVTTLNNTDARVVYTDEDLIGDDASRHSTFSKPGFNLNLLYSHNYITHFLVVEQGLFWEVGGLNSDKDGAQDYDLILRLSEMTNDIVHIPRILYHWRALESSTSINHGQKSYAHQAGRIALQESLDRRGGGVIVEDTDLNFFYRTRYLQGSEGHSIAVVFPFTNIEEYERICSILEQKIHNENSSYTAIWMDSSNPVFTMLQSERDDGTLNVQTITGLAHNAAVSSQAEYLVFLGGRPTELEQGWLNELINPLLDNDDDIGIVSGQAIIEQSTERSFTLPDINNYAEQYFAAFLASRSTHMNGLHCQQLVSCSNGDFIMMRGTVYSKLGGLDYTNLSYDFAMLDLSLRAGQQGIKVLYSPFARIKLEKTHYQKLGLDNTDSEVNKEKFQARWIEWLTEGDPYYNMGLLDENKINRALYLEWLTGTKTLGKS